MKKLFTLLSLLMVTLFAHADYYMIGNLFNGWNLQNAVKLEPVGENGDYATEFTYTGDAYFVFSDANNDWSIINNGHRFGPTDGDQDVTVGTETTTQRSNNGNASYKMGCNGKYKVTFNPTTFKFKVERVLSTTYYLVGFINGSDYDDKQYMFNETGELTVTFTEMSYVYVKSADNKEFHPANYVNFAYPSTEVMLELNMKEKMSVPQGEVVFTLKENNENQIILKASAEQPATSKYFMKHPWDGGGWSWKELESNGDGTYSVVAKFGNEGVNINNTATDAGSVWIDLSSIQKDGNLKAGTVCEFTLTPNDNSVSITEVASPIVYVIVDGNQMKLENKGNYSYSSGGNSITFDKDSEHTISFKMVDTSGNIKYLNPNSTSDGSNVIYKNQTVKYQEGDTQESFTFNAPSDKPCHFAVNLNKKLVVISTDIVTGVEDVEVAGKAVKAYKVIENGQVVIVRGEQRFNIMGQPIR